MSLTKLKQIFKGQLKDTNEKTNKLQIEHTFKIFDLQRDILQAI